MPREDGQLRTKTRQESDSASTGEISSADRVVDAIVRRIRSGTYVPGQRLIEADLTRDLSVSRGPVREALKRMAAEGVVTLTRHRGAYVRSLTRQEVKDSLIVLEVLTGLMARLAARQVGVSDNAARMRNALNRLLGFRDAGDGAAFLDERRRYYHTIIEIGGNGQLGRILPLMQIHLLRMQFQSYITPRDREKQFEEYTAITDAVLSGEPKRAERVMRAHIRRTRARLSRLPDEAFATSSI